MERTLANLLIKGKYWWIFGLTIGGIVGAEIIYYHLLGLEGALSSLFSIQEEVRNQGWWNNERKGVWIAGAVWGVSVASGFVLKFQRL